MTGSSAPLRRHHKAVVASLAGATLVFGAIAAADDPFDDRTVEFERGETDVFYPVPDAELPDPELFEVPAVPDVEVPDIPVFEPPDVEIVPPSPPTSTTEPDG